MQLSPKVVHTTPNTRLCFGCVTIRWKTTLHKNVVMRCILMWGQLCAAYLCGDNYALHTYVGTIMCCILMWGQSLSMISSLRNIINPPKKEINPPWTACGCMSMSMWRGKQKTTTTKRSHTSHPTDYNYTYRVTPTVFSSGTLQQHQQHQQLKTQQTKI